MQFEIIFFSVQIGENMFTNILHQLDKKQLR